MSFGGSVKLTGESEYRQAIKNCISSLQSMSTALKAQTADFSNNDKSIKNSAAAQKQLNETIKTQQAELSKAKSAYASYQVALQNQTTKHNLLNKEYKNAVIELERIKKASGESSNEYQKQAQVVDKLEKELIDSNEAMNESKTAMASLRSEINNSNKTISNAEKALNDLGNEAEDSGKQAQKGSEGFTVMKGVLADLASRAIASAINGLKKLGMTTVNIGKQAISSFAEYEQLVGGVETLFKDSSKEVQAYADRAYKTAGISANKYMEQATSFSASLLQGLGGDTAKAAKIADMAIIDMSDNANKMGTSIEMIQNAYQGFAKDNFTMLDNLKLGYGGTAGEMARLINETGVMGKAFKATAQNVKDVPFDKMIEAIHEVQVQMGITGTTSIEAADTIQGSAGSMKASWENLLTAIADKNQDLGKKIDEFVSSVVVAGKNLVPRVKQVTEGIKKLINSVITEVFPKLKREIPQLAPLIDTFNWFVKNRSLVVGAVSAMVGAFALNKILSFGKGLSDTTKVILNIAKGTAVATAATNANTVAEATNTAGKVAATGATGALTAATNLLNAAWKANPIGLVITGLTVAIGVFAALKSKTDEATKAQREQSKALEEAAQKAEEANKAYDDLRASQQKQIDAGMTEISHYESLYDELQGIVDQNGKVKKGYEERASFITSTLSEALGIEIKNVDGVIQGYDNLKSTIDEVMEKKKAQIVLDSQESLYKEAINGQTNALKELNKAEQELSIRKSERKTIEDELAVAQEKFNERTAIGTEEAFRAAQPIALQIEKLKEKMRVYDEDTAKVQSTYDTQKELLSKYAFDIGQYESNMAAAHAGEYEKMSQVNWEYVKDYEKAGDAEKARLEDQIKITETNLNLLKELKDKSGNDLYDSQIKASEKLLKEQQDSLKQYETATKTGLDATKIQWSGGLDNILSEITGANVEFKEDGKGNVTMYANGVKQGEPKSKEEMAKLVSNTIAEVTKKDKDAKKAGEDLIDGVNNGVKNQDKQSGVFTSIKKFGSSLLGKLRESLKEHSPSKATNEMGQFLLEGLGLGIKSKENSVLKQITNFGKSVIGSLNTGLSDTINTSAITDIGNMSSVGIAGSRLAQVNQTENNIDMIEAFKQALSQMKIELDDEVAGEFVEKTVTKVVYS